MWISGKETEERDMIQETTKTFEHQGCPQTGPTKPKKDGTFTASVNQTFRIILSHDSEATGKHIIKPHRYS